jgi:hypothetical protein
MSENKSESAQSFQAFPAVIDFPPDPGKPLPPIPPSLAHAAPHITLLDKGYFIRYWGQTHESAKGPVQRHGDIELWDYSGQTRLFNDIVYYRDNNDEEGIGSSTWTAVSTATWIVARYTADPQSVSSWSKPSSDVILWHKRYGTAKGHWGTFVWFVYFSKNRAALEALSSPLP